MCELLVRTKDKGDGLTFAGDVVAVQRDGWPWGTSEYGAGAHPFWRVVKLPGVPEFVFQDMLEPAIDAAGNLLAKRAKHFHALKGGHLNLDDMNSARRVKAFNKSAG